MADYLITKQDGVDDIVIPDGQLNENFTLPFVGQNYFGYGKHVAQNQLRMLEHFMSDTAPENAVRGQQWYKMDPGYIVGDVGVMKVWTGADPSDMGYNPITDGSQVIGNAAQWVGIGPIGIDDGYIGTVLDPYNDIYCTNIYAVGANSSFNALFVGAGGAGITMNSTSLLPDPDSINDSTGVYLGNATHRFRESHVRNAFLYGSFNIGDFTTNKNVKLIVDNTQNYTLLPDPAQTVHLGMPSAPTKRFASVNAVTTNTTSLEVGAGAGEGIGSDLVPKITNTYTLGNTSYKYNNVYTENVTVETVKRASATSKVGESGTPFLEMHATTFYGLATQAQYADVAERYEADAVYGYGTVIKFGGDKEITQTTSESDVDVYGVVSKNPAFKMNAEAGDDNTHPYIALVGRVPVKVVGKVKKHQKLISSNIGGVAKAVDADTILDVRQVIGRALEDKNDDDVGYVEAAVGVR